MSWFTKNIIENPFINQIGGIAKLIQKNNGGDANERVANWIKNNPPFPGCDGSLTSDCSYDGTAADWETYRRNWIDDCTALNTSGILVSKNKTRASCQANFDQKTSRISADMAARNLEDKNYIQSLIGKDNPMIYLAFFLFAAVIIYLLLS